MILVTIGTSSTEYDDLIKAVDTIIPLLDQKVVMYASYTLTGPFEIFGAKTGVCYL